MKKRGIFYIILITILCVIGMTNNNTYAYTGISSQTLFEPSTFDSLILNYTSLPTVTVSGSTGYYISDETINGNGSDVGYVNRRVTYTGVSSGQTLDSTINVFFSNCGTLNGSAIDMKLVYSDIVTNGTNVYLYWTAFGSSMQSINEWWYNCVEHVNVKIYFYYHGSSTPISFDIAYLSLFSEDEGEGAGSKTSTAEYLYNSTTMTYSSSHTSSISGRTYTDFYYGLGGAGSTEGGGLNCVAFQYKNANYLNVDLYGINGKSVVGYHLQYTPLTATVPSSPVKSVDKTESELNDTLTYTVTQKISSRYDDSFYYSSLVFTDTIDSNLTYNSLKVYNSSGTDVTSSAGTVSYDSSTRKLTYTFSSSYLKNTMSYSGETYKFVITTTVNSSSTSATISDTAQTIINNSTTLTSNTVTTTLKAKVVVHHVNKLGVALADDETINGNLLDSYTTSAKSIYGYEYVSDSGNTAGTMQVNTTEVTYVYDLIRVNINITKLLEATDSTVLQSLAGARFTLTVNEFYGLVSLANPDEIYLSTYTDENGDCIIEGVPFGEYTIVEDIVPSVAYSGIFYLGNSTSRITSFTIDVSSDTDLSYTLTDVAKKMQIIIYKEDTETGTTTQGDADLTGAKYTIYRDEECTDPIETLTIAKNADGTYSATSGWYLVGTYYIKEDVKEEVNGTKYSYAEGYLVDETVYTISQDPSKQTGEYSTHTLTSTEDVIRNDIVIIKNIGETSNTEQVPLDKCEFTATLVSSIGTGNEFSIKCTAQTDENGYCIIENLPYGKYVIEETTVSPISLKCANFYVDIKLDKSDKTDPYTPSDAYKWDEITLGEEVGTTKTYSTTYGWLDNAGNIVDVPKVMQIKIRKVDEYATEADPQYTQGDAVIEGAIYQIYRYDPKTDDYTEYVYDITVDKIDDEGYWYAQSDDLLVGKYMVVEKVRETKVGNDGVTYKYSYAEGYLVDETKYYYEVDPETQDVRVTYHTQTSTEQVIRGSVDVIKYNNIKGTTEETPATGAVLRLTLNSNPEVYYEATIDEYGYLEFVEEKSREKYYPYTIPYGEYTITEVQSSNSGENIFIYEQTVTISESSQEEHYILEDDYVELRLTIKKVDEETGEIIPVSGTFKIWDVAANDWYGEITYPSGYVDEFSTNENGYLTLNGCIDAGTYVIYEIEAPYGYYLEDEMRVGAKGYEFTVAVNGEGEVIVYADDEETTLSYDLEKYENIMSRIYKYTATIKDTPQKVIIKITDIAEQFTKVEEEESKYGDVETPVFEKEGLEGAEFDIIAAEDVYTEDGTLRYTKGEVVAHITTDENGKCETEELYLGKYYIVQTNVPDGYIIADTVTIEVEYTDQYEKVQVVEVEYENEKQEVNLEFEKIFEELEVSNFKFDEKKAVFGIYTAKTIKNYRGENTIGQDELVDIIETDENNKVVNNVELPEGEYYIKELYVSNPYKLVNDVYYFTVEYNNTQENIEVTINDGEVINEASIGELEVLVYPEDIYEEYGIDEIEDVEELESIAKEYGLANKVYQIYNDEECENPLITNEGEYAAFETDEMGRIYIPDMPTGIYYIKETVAAYGYELSDEIIRVEISEGKLTVATISEPLKKAKLIEKRDGYTKDIIEGVTFEITDEEENVIYEGETDEEGIVWIPIIYLENGKTYYYEEKDGPSIYEIDETKYEFVAEYDEEKCEWTLELIEVVNERKTIDKLIIRKTDSQTGEALEGCVFTIVLLNENGEEYVNEYGDTIYLVENGETDENGEYVIENVPYGTYKFKEIVAPEGYELDEDLTGYTFTIDEDSPDTVIFEVTNTGDIAVIALAILGIVCIAGIVFVVVRNKKK